MDDQYLDAFIRESEDAITELNNSLLDLEPLASLGRPSSATGTSSTSSTW